MTEYIYYVTQASRAFTNRHSAVGYKALWDRKYSPRKCEILAMEKDGGRHNLFKPVILGELHGDEYRKDERESNGRDVHSTRHRLYEAECPECGSEDIEVIQWDEPMTSSVKAVCDCGFEHREDYSHREAVHQDRPEAPVEQVAYEVIEVPGQWWSGQEFSPRQFLKMAEEGSP